MCNCKETEFELIPELTTILRNFEGGSTNQFEVNRVKAVASTPSFVKSFSGPANECSSALKRAGKTQVQALSIINAQIAKAIGMLRVADKKLEQGKRSKETNETFKRIFKVFPRFVPTWLKQTSSIRDRGDVVAFRCRKVADLLASGSIRFFCSINSINCPDCGNSNTPFACSSWGDESVAPANSNVICLGSPFWDAMRNNELTSMLATLMHEPFHIYFGKYVTEHGHSSGRSVGKFGGINCIVQFVFDINKHKAPERVNTRCKDTVTRNAGSG